MDLLKWGTSNKDKRILVEDILKTIYNGSKSHNDISINFIAEKIGANKAQLKKLIDQMRDDGYLEDNTLSLSSKGKEYAINIVRKHRLYEKFLSEKSGYEPSEWHEQACRMEHEISDSEGRKLAKELNNPLFDPHGDPIPDENNNIAELNSLNLADCKKGDILKVLQLRDWPKEYFKELQKIGLFPKSIFSILEIDNKQISILFEGECFSFDIKLADNLKVQYCEDQLAIKLLGKVKRLSSLKIGEEARIVAISHACKGIVRRRLLDLGFVRGSIVSIDLTSPLGNPTAYVVRGTAIALRRDQAAYILIEKENV